VVPSPYDEDLDRLYLPRGLLEGARRLIAAAGSRLDVDDRRPSATAQAFSFTGQLTAAQTRRSGIVDVVTIQTLARRDDVAEMFTGYGLVVVDECHHLPVATFERSFHVAANRRWVGLTATPPPP